MDKAFKNMDNRFKTIDNELNYSYDSSLWGSASELLNDSIMDSAFVTAAKANTISSSPNFSDLNTVFLDDSFKVASQASSARYNQSFFGDFKAKEATLYQDDSFTTAATQTKPIYDKKYWGVAQQALKKEGLHFEYKTAYWKEAELLLNQKSRQAFFWKWGSVASILLLISFIGFKSQDKLTTNKYSSRLNSLNIESLNSFNPDNTNINTSNTKGQNYNRLTSHIGNYVKRSGGQFESETKNNLHQSNTTKSNQKLNNTVQNNQSNNTSLVTSNSNDLTKTKVSNTDVVLITTISETINDHNYKNNKNILMQISHIEIPLVTLNTNYNTLLAKTQDITQSPIKITGTHQFGVRLLKGLGNNFNNNTNTLSARNSFYLDYRYKPNQNRFFIGADLGLYHMNLANYEFENKYTVHHLDGDIDNYWYKMTYKDLIYLSSSLNMFYTINPKHKIKMAVGMNKLVTSKIDVAYKSAKKDTKTELGNRWGKNNGINNFDLSLGLGYEFKLHKQFDFIMETKLGVLDQTNNDYLQSTIKNNDFSFQIGLKYNIFSISK